MTEKPHFDISAHVVRQLGEELVSDEVTALLELVKNAYDADASYVNIVVNTNYPLNDRSLYYAEVNSLTPGYITLEDDGTGMGRQEIEKGWLRISFSAKRRMREKKFLTPKKKRVPLGDKGLGRLSTQRLGNRLEIFTHKEVGIPSLWDLADESEQENNRTDEAQIEHHVAFNWAEFTEDQQLTQVSVHWEELKSERPRKGTKLIVTDLRDLSVWTEKEQDVVRQLSQVISPYEEVRPFNVYLTINAKRVDLSTVVERLRELAVTRFSFEFAADQPQVKSTNPSLEHYSLIIKGKIKLSRLGSDAESYELVGKDKGKEFFSFLTNPENRYALEEATFVGEGNYFINVIRKIEFTSLGELSKIKNDLANPGAFRGEIDEFYFQGVDIEPVQDVFSTRADYRDTLKELVGIKIYRDGFAVKPYGIDGNDWLGFGKQQTSARSFYGIRPGNVTGYIALNATASIELKEKTDREGFVDNPYSRNFFRLMEEVREYTAYVLFNLRRSFNEYKRRYAEEQPEFISTGEFTQKAQTISSTSVVVQERIQSLEREIGQVSTTVREIVTKTE